MSPDSKTAEKAELLTRWRLTLDAVERAEPQGTSWAELRAVGERSTNNLRALRNLAREATVMAGLLPAPIKADLEAALAAAGINMVAERTAEAAAIAPIRARGRIRTEAEYRRVQSYADTLVAPEQQDEFLALGALLDEFMSRGAI